MMKPFFPPAQPLFQPQDKKFIVFPWEQDLWKQIACSVTLRDESPPEVGTTHFEAEQIIFLKADPTETCLRM